MGDAVDDDTTPGIDEQGLIFKELPVVGVSLVDVLGGASTGDFLTGFKDAIQTAISAATNLQQVETQINLALTGLMSDIGIDMRSIINTGNNYQLRVLSFLDYHQISI